MPVPRRPEGWGSSGAWGLRQNKESPPLGVARATDQRPTGGVTQPQLTHLGKPRPQEEMGQGGIFSSQ